MALSRVLASQCFLWLCPAGSHMFSSLSVSKAVPNLGDKHPNMSKALGTGPQCALAVDSPWTDTSTAAMKGFLQKCGLRLSTDILGPAAQKDT